MYAVFCTMIVLIVISGYSNAYGFSTHEPLNEESLKFLASNILKKINDANTWVDRWYSTDAQGTSKYHFDDCEFNESVIFINEQQKKQLH